MSNTYLSFISDSDYRKCVSSVFNAYNGKNEFDKSDLNKNHPDPFKLKFDQSFLGLSDNELVEREKQRQIEKTATNAIGLFHEKMLGSVKGYINLPGQGWDIKSEDELLFAELKNKFNTMNSSSMEQVFIKLQNIAEEHPNAICYCVQILADESFDRVWSFTSHNKKYEHPRVRIISGDRFYALVTGVPDALKQVYDTLSTVCKEVKEKEDYKQLGLWEDLPLYEQIMGQTDKSFVNKIAYDNYKQYIGFNEL